MALSSFLLCCSNAFLFDQYGIVQLTIIAPISGQSIMLVPLSLEDLVILILPLPRLNTLQLPLNKRIGLVLMFGVGSFACVTRLKYLAQVDTSYDITWDDVNVLIWSVIESAATDICACLPALRPLILKYIPSLYKTAKSTTKSTWNSIARIRRRSKRMSGFEFPAESSIQKSAKEIQQEWV
ncbi:hypothetical protein BDZ45DRAFT_306545 [Acephala macrosclerotiorum]|nr:hypothetical protein BDZ45DRAFT_306545 [Acephala macrosclerotiorum]